MINIEGLRVGNYVEHVMSKGPVRVTKIKEHKARDRVFYTVFVSDRKESLLPEHLFPVLVTEEVLLKTGYKTRHGIISTSKYLHNMQNLYFGLTGHELEINL